MKKASTYLITIVIVGIAITSFWIYEKYIRTSSGELTTAIVTRGAIQESVRARGEVVAQKEFNLEFPFSGIVEKIYVHEGELVKSGAPLVKLETNELILQKERLNDVLLQNSANLQKLESGVTLEDINVYEARVESARISLTAAQKNLSDAIVDAFTKADDAVRTKIDPLFINPRTTPQLSFQISNNQLKIDMESARTALEPTLGTWGDFIKSIAVTSDLEGASVMSATNLSLVRTMHDKAALSISNLSPTGSLTQTTIDAWRANISAGRVSISTAITNLTAAKEKLENAKANLGIAENELALRRAGTRAEELVIAQAQVNAVKSEIASVDENLARSILRAPADAKVVKIWPERKEATGPGKTAISLSIDKLKIQADISELDIGKIIENDGSTVDIEFDAFPGTKYAGTVLSVEQKEILKEGDKYFRVNILFNEKTISNKQIRTGMSADLVIKGALKKDVLMIPEIAVYKSSGKRFVKVVRNNISKEVEVVVGISDGDSIEIISGLNEGETVVISN